MKTLQYVSKLSKQRRTAGEYDFDISARRDSDEANNDFVSSGPSPAGPFIPTSQISPRICTIMPLSSRNRVLVVSPDHVPPDLVTRLNT